MDITPTDTQAKAIAAIQDWFKNRTEEQQIFRCFGFAGVGKSTIVKLAIQDLGLDPDDPFAIRFCAFTGKAALVMRRAGTPTAQTVHSLIYSVTEATEEEIEAAKIRLMSMESDALKIEDRLERGLADAQIVAMRQAIKKMKLPQFGLNPESALRDAKLLVLDECSMIGPEMAADILSFKKPVLVLGDPGQLPPIRGEGFFTEGTKPDVMLTEIHRQAAESPIIRLATMARKGEPIPYGAHGNDEMVFKMSRGEASPEMLLAGGADTQVICGMNATRLSLNNAMRRAAGHGLGGEILPTGPAEKVIILKNRNDIGLINGCFCELSEIEEIDGHRFKAVLKTEDGLYPGDGDNDGEGWDEGDKHKPLRFYAGHFHDHVAYDKDRLDRDYKLKKGLVEATFGWAITCHKAQGSGWENVIVWDDGLGRTKLDRNRWLYTACTRAISGLLILD